MGGALGCDAPKDLDGAVALAGSSERSADVIIEIPGAEVTVVSGDSKEAAIVARGSFRLLRLQPKDREDGPGRYVIEKPTKVGRDMTPGSNAAGDADGLELPVGTIVNVVEALEVASHDRVRARIEEPPGWISLTAPKAKQRWAQKLEVAVFHIGSTEGKQDEAFYYPVAGQVPVLLVFETRVMTVSAGEGDTFAIRLPAGTAEEKITQLAQVLPSFCNFRLSKQKDVTDYVSGAASGIVDVIGMGASLLAAGMSKGSVEAKKHIEPKEEVHISEGTKAAVSTTKHVAVGTVNVASSVMDGLVNTAAYLGKEAGKQVAESKGGSSAAGSKAATPSAASKTGMAVLTGGLQVFDALIKASDKLSTTAADETAGIVGHKYGADAGSVARDGLTTAGAALELKDMVGKKAVGKLAAKGAMYTAGGIIEGAAMKPDKK